ncbi:hypothetical protein D1003_06435 [Riemerella anatipestifer]|nr:hypothetical protein [Riemerella anatipestifer]
MSLYHSNFSFHQYWLKARLSHKHNWFKSSRFKFQIFKEVTGLLNYEPRTLNLELLNFEQLQLLKPNHQPLKL